MSRKPGRITSASKSRESTTVEKVDEKDLIKEIEACIDALTDLRQQVREQTDVAMEKGDLDTAVLLEDRSSDYTLKIGILQRMRLKEIDNSQAMIDAINAFADVNSRIKEAIKDTANLIKFLNSTVAISAILDRLIRMVIA